MHFSQRATDKLRNVDQVSKSRCFTHALLAPESLLPNLLDPWPVLGYGSVLMATQTSRYGDV